MSWLEAVTEIVNRYQSTTGGHPNDTATHEDYQQVVQSAPRDAVANGIAGMFKSSETPPFAEMVSNLFGQSNPDQKAGLLSHLLSGASAEKPGSELSPDQVQQIAAKAEARDPGIIERVSGFYAQHPGLMKAVGGLALTVAMKHMKNRS